MPSIYNYKTRPDVLSGRPIDTTLDYNVGEMVYYDTVNNIYKTDITDVLALTFAGVCLDQVPTASIGDRVADVRGINVALVGLYEFYTTNAETYVDGTVVGVGADNITVSTAAANPIGKVVMKDQVASVTGASGVKVLVLIQNILFADIAI